MERINRLYRRPIVIPLLLLLVTLGAAAQTRVGLVPIESDDSVPQLQSVLTTAADTVALTIQLLGDFTVLPVEAGTFESADEYFDATDLGTVDRVVTLRASRPDNRYVVTARVWDPLTRDVTFTSEESVDSVLFLFDIVDQLVVSLVGEIAGRRIAFGSMNVVLSGWDVDALRGADAPRIGGEALGELLDATALAAAPDPEWILEVDGVRLGEKITTVERLLEGTRRIVVLERRGDELVRIVERDLEIEAGATAVFSAAVPVLAPGDASLVSDQLERISNEPSSEMRVALWTDVVDILSGATQYAPPLDTAIAVAQDARLAAEIAVLEDTLTERWGELDARFFDEIGLLSNSIAERLVAVDPDTTSPGIHSATMSLLRRSDAVLGQRSEELFRILTILAAAESADEWNGIEARYRTIADAADRNRVAYPPWFTQDLAVVTALFNDFREGPDLHQRLYRWMRYGGLGFAGAGAAMVGASFPIYSSAEDLYGEYENATSPADARDLHERAQNREDTARAFQGVGITAVVLGATSLGSSYLLERRDTREPQETLNDRLEAYFQPRADLYGDLARSRRGRIVENPPPVELPIDGFMETVPEPPEGILLARPVDSGAVRETEPDASYPTVSYPGVSIDINSFTNFWDPDPYSDPDTAFYRVTAGTGVGIGIYTTGHLPVAMGFSLGISASTVEVPVTLADSAFALGYGSGDNQWGYNNLPAYSGWLLLGNPWRAAGIGIYAATDGIRDQLFWALQVRRVRFGVSMDPEYHGDSAIMFAGYAHPADPETGFTLRGASIGGIRERERREELTSIRNRYPVTFRWAFGGHGGLGGGDDEDRLRQYASLYPVVFPFTVDPMHDPLHNSNAASLEIQVDLSERHSIATGVRLQTEGSSHIATLVVDDTTQTYDLELWMDGPATSYYGAWYYHFLPRLAGRVEFGGGSSPIRIEDISGFTDAYGSFEGRSLPFYESALGFDWTMVRRSGYSVHIEGGVRSILTFGIGDQFSENSMHGYGYAVLALPQGVVDPKPLTGASRDRSERLSDDPEWQRLVLPDRGAITSVSFTAFGRTETNDTGESFMGIAGSVGRETGRYLAEIGIGGTTDVWQNPEFTVDTSSSGIDSGDFTLFTGLGFGTIETRRYVGVRSYMIFSGETFTVLPAPTVWLGPMHISWLPSVIYSSGSSQFVSVGVRLYSFRGNPITGRVHQ